MTTQPSALRPSEPPHDLDAERAVLGAMLVDPGCAIELPADAYYDPRHAMISDACQTLRAQGIAPDMVTLSAYLRERGELERVGGASYLSELVDALPDVAGVAAYAAIVARCARHRDLAAVMRRYVDAPSDDALAAVGAAIAEHDRVTAPSQLGQLWRPLGLEALTTRPQPRRWLLERPGGDGLMPMGRVGILAAEGGSGKTHVLLSLACSVVTGRPWLGYLTVPDYATEGRALLLMGEECADEVHRRLWAIADGLRLTDAERRACADGIVIVPMAGYPAALTTAVGGQLVETPLMAETRRRLEEGADGRGWSLVGIDPMSRYAGGDVESSNETATRYMQAVESLCRAPGDPSVMVSAHASKWARRQGQADVRGVTGLTDAARWVATMWRDGEHICFQQVKSNYSLPMTEPLRLDWRGGILSAITPEDAEAIARRELVERTASIDRDVDAVVDALRRSGSLGTKLSIARVAGMRAKRGIEALDIAMARGLVVRTGNARHPEYRVVDGGVCVSSPPYTPRECGNAFPGVGGTHSHIERECEGMRERESPVKMMTRHSEGVTNV